MPFNIAKLLRRCTSWTNPSRYVMLFRENGTIESAARTVDLGNYTVLTWYMIKIRYERPSPSEVKLSYWINGEYKGTEIVSSHPEEDQFTNLNLTCQEGTAWFDNIRVYEVSPKPIAATIDLDPNTLNLKSKGKWITCYIEIPDDYDVNDIDISTVKISHIGVTETEIFAESKPTEISDYDENGIADLMVKFDRESVIDELIGTTGDIELTVIGKVDEKQFEGKDTINVINNAKKEMVKDNLSFVSPRNFALFQNYPNPFNPSTSISFILPTNIHVLLEIYNIFGEKIITLLEEQKNAGQYFVEWNGKNGLGTEVAAGIYVCKIQAGNYQRSIRMLFLK